MPSVRMPLHRRAVGLHDTEVSLVNRKQPVGRGDDAEADTGVLEEALHLWAESTS